jgi:hypothetical protein
MVARAPHRPGAWKFVESLCRRSAGGCVFRKSVTGVFGIVTDDFGNVTGHFGNVTGGVGSVI